MVLLSFVDSTSASAAAEIVMVGVLGAGEGITSVCVARVMGGSGVGVEVDHLVVLVVVSGVVEEAVRFTLVAMMGARPLSMYNAFSSLTKRWLSGPASLSASLRRPGIMPARDAGGCEGACGTLGPQ